MKTFRILVLLLTLTTTFVGYSQFESKIRIINIDLGQGDGTLILTKDGKGGLNSVLVDCGDNKGREPEGKDGGVIIWNILEEYGIDTLDYMITSHYDSDHLGGLAQGGYPQRPDYNGTSFVMGPDDKYGTNDDKFVRFWIDRGDNELPSSPSSTYKKWKKSWERMVSEDFSQRISIETQKQVNTYEIDLGNGIKFICLAGNGLVRDTNEDDVDITKRTPNALSLCFMLEYLDFQFLVGGDLIGEKYGSEDAKIEDAVGDYLQDRKTKVDVLHANHHGAGNGSATTFLEKIKVRNVVISHGRHTDHKHPNIKALRRLAKSTAQYIYQVDKGTTKWDTKGVSSDDKERIWEKQRVSNGDIIIDVYDTKYKIYGGELECSEFKFNK